MWGLQAVQHSGSCGLRKWSKTQLGPELVGETSEALPSHHLDDGVAHLIRHAAIWISRLDICQGMRKTLRRTPRHCKHQV